MDPGDELVEVVDLDLRPVGVVTRREVRSRNLLHRSTAILVRRPGGEVLVHRRTDTKDVHPGLYDLFVGGVVTAGESEEASARRELAEETGIEGVPLRPLGRFLYQGPSLAEWASAYEVVWSGALRPQPTEVAWADFVPEAELDRMLASLPFAPDAVDLWQRLRADGPT